MATKKFLLKAFKQNLIFEKRPNIFVDTETGKRVDSMKDIKKIQQRFARRKKEVERLRRFN